MSPFKSMLKGFVYAFYVLMAMPVFLVQLIVDLYS